MIDHDVNAAEEEAGHRRHARDVSAGCGAPLQTADEGFSHRFVIVDSENQRDIDVDAGGDGCFDGWQPLGRGWNLDHQVGPVDGLEEARRFIDRALGIARQQRRHFQADITIAALAALIDGAKEVSRVLDVFNSQRFIDRFRFQIKHGQDVVVIGIGIADGFLEYRWIRGDAEHAFFVDPALQSRRFPGLGDGYNPARRFARVSVCPARDCS